MIHDERKAPFFWATPSATGAIRRGHEDGLDPGLSSVLAVYFALLEIANERRARSTIGSESGAFSAERRRVAQYAGVSVKTVDRCLAVLVRLELLRVERRRVEGDRNMPNTFVLVEVGDSESPRGGTVVAQGGGLSDAQLLQEEQQNSQEEKAASKSEGQNFTSLAAAVVRSFNEVAGTELAESPHLAPIVGRIRERPDLTADHHRQLIEAVFAGKRWWDDPPAPEIIYGNPKQFSRALELLRRSARKVEPAFDVNAEMDRVRREQGLA